MRLLGQFENKKAFFEFSAYGESDDDNDNVKKIDELLCEEANHTFDQVDNEINEIREDLENMVFDI